jgi:hypothetical protein
MFWVPSNNNNTDPLAEYNRMKAFVDLIKNEAEAGLKKKEAEAKAKKDYWTTFLQLCVLAPIAALIFNTAFMFFLFKFIEMAQKIKLN